MSFFIFREGRIVYLSGQTNPAAVRTVSYDHKRFYSEYGFAVPVDGICGSYKEMVEGSYDQSYFMPLGGVEMSWVVINHFGRAFYVIRTYDDKAEQLATKRWPLHVDDGSTWVSCRLSADKDLMMGFLDAKVTEDHFDQLVQRHGIAGGFKPTWTSLKDVLTELNNLYPLPPGAGEWVPVDRDSYAKGN